MGGMAFMRHWAVVLSLSFLVTRGGQEVATTGRPVADWTRVPTRINVVSDTAARWLLTHPARRDLSWRTMSFSLTSPSAVFDAMLSANTKLRWPPESRI